MAASARAAVREQKEMEPRGLQAFFQRLARREFCGFAGWYPHFLASARVAPLSCLALHHLEAAETGNVHGITLFQGRLDDAEKALIGGFRLGQTGKAGFFLQRFDNFRFSHDSPSH